MAITSLTRRAGSKATLLSSNVEQQKRLLTIMLYKVNDYPFEWS